MYPDFLGIGAQKAGTTWLHTNLSQHRQIWMPPVKEFHYFDRGADLSPAKLLFGTAKRARKARAFLMQQIRARLRREPADLSWALRYCFAPRSDDWYASLFPPVAGKITGEICPGYAPMRGDAVARVRRLMPRSKIIYFIRNPVDRSWSYAAQYFTSPRWKGRYGSLDRVPEPELLAFLDENRHGHSDYVGALEAWTGHFGAEQMFVACFDELATDPVGLLKRVLDFLGVDSSADAIPASAAMNQDRGRGSGMPHQIRTHLSKLHHEQLLQLHARLNNQWTASWLTSAEQAIGKMSTADRAAQGQSGERA